MDAGRRDSPVPTMYERLYEPQEHASQVSFVGLGRTGCDSIGITCCQVSKLRPWTAIQVSFGLSCSHRRMNISSINSNIMYIMYNCSVSTCLND